VSERVRECVCVCVCVWAHAPHLSSSKQVDFFSKAGMRAMPSDATPTMYSVISYSQ
jgi:hypothetical protein